MKLYRHYKGPFYKYIDIARHSETMEELVVYESRKESSAGRLWVRPREMFFEEVTLDERPTPRFAPVPISIEETVDPTDQELASLASLIERSLGGSNPKHLRNRLDNHNRSLLLVARVDGKPVGLKLGYEQNVREFYSWLGGVDPDYRGFGIASALMKHQHAWCKDNGYEVVRTKSQNRFKEMLILNLRHGFEVVGFEGFGEQGPKTVLEKRLRSLEK